MRYLLIVPEINKETDDIIILYDEPAIAFEMHTDKLVPYNVPKPKPEIEYPDNEIQESPRSYILDVPDDVDLYDYVHEERKEIIKNINGQFNRTFEDPKVLYNVADKFTVKKIVPEAYYYPGGLYVFYNEDTEEYDFYHDNQFSFPHIHAWKEYDPENMYYSVAQSIDDFLEEEKYLKINRNCCK